MPQCEFFSVCFSERSELNLSRKFYFIKSDRKNNDSVNKNIGIVEVECVGSILRKTRDRQQKVYRMIYNEPSFLNSRKGFIHFLFVRLIIVFK